MPSATPDPSSRICKKLVLKGHATQRGASYTLFIKAELPHNPKAQTYSLLPEKNVRLKDAVVHPLDLAGAAPALSGSAARAASYLGIPLSINHDLSTSLLGSDGRTTPSTRRRSIGSARRPSDSFSSNSVPRVTVSNFNINLVAPPLFGLDSSSNVAETSRGPSTPSRKNVAGFIIILQLEVGLASTPPRGPYMIRMPKPFCLNNYLKFAVDESVSPGSQDIAVEIDPVVLPRRRRGKVNGASSTQSHDVADDDDVITLGPSSDLSDDEDEDGTTISGSFASCDALTIRWADPKAGDFVPTVDSLPALPTSLRAASVHSNVYYSLSSDDTARPTLQAQAELEHIRLDVQIEASLIDLSYPGLEQEAFLQVVMDPYGQEGSFTISDVNAGPTLLSWRQLDYGDESVLTETSTDFLQQASDTLQASAQSSLIRKEADISAADEDDLLKITPPRALSDGNLDFSIDEGSGKSSSRSRSLISRNGTPRPSTPTRNAPLTSTFGESTSLRNGIVRLAVNVSTVLASDQPLQVTIRGHLSLKAQHGSLPRPNTEEQTTLALPVPRFPTADEHLSIISSRAETDHVNPGASVPFFISTFRRSQWTDSRGQIKLEPSPSSSRPLPGHGFDSEASVVVIKARHAELVDEKPEKVASSLPGPQDESKDVVLEGEATSASQRAVLSAKPTDTAMSPASSKVEFALWPILGSKPTARLEIQLQFVWPCLGQGLSSRATIRLPPGCRPISAFVNSRHANMEVGLAGDQLTVQLPPQMSSGLDLISAEVLFTSPWDGTLEFVASLPKLLCRTMRAELVLHGAGKLRPHVAELGPFSSANQRPDGSVNLVAFDVGLDDVLDVDVALTKEKVEMPRSSRSFSFWRFSHILWTLFLTAFALGSFHTLEPAITLLNERIDQLAMALDVDFRDGRYKLSAEEIEVWNSAGVSVEPIAEPTKEILATHVTPTPIVDGARDDFASRSVVDRQPTALAHKTESASAAGKLLRVLASPLVVTVRGGNLILRFLRRLLFG